MIAIAMLAYINEFGSTDFSTMYKSEIALPSVYGMSWLDKGLLDHQSRVCRITDAIAEEMSLSGSERMVLHLASAVHDIGKVFAPGFILNARRKLTKEEYAVVKCHPIDGERFLVKIKNLPRIVSILVLQHHEFFDGTGYPFGLKGDKIDPKARIITLADSYDAMTSRRPYRDAKSQDAAIAEILACAGSQFDPLVVECFLKIVERGVGIGVA